MPHLRMIGAGALVALSVAACQAGPRGGTLIDRSRIPQGRLIASFTRSQCTDRSHEYQEVQVDYVQGPDGRPFVVERTVARRWMVLTNSFVERHEIVFQAVRHAKGKVLIEYRFPQDGTSPGRYAVTNQFTEQGTQHSFRAQIVGPPVTCQIHRIDSTPGGVAAPSGSGPPAPAASTSAGWAFDGKSFQVGDRVLVDVAGRSVGATVLQAPGVDYFVHYDGSPEGEGEWVKASRITGQIK